jgi:hypothetical protein
MHALWLKVAKNLKYVINSNWAIAIIGVLLNPIGTNLCGTSCQLWGWSFQSLTQFFMTRNIVLMHFVVLAKVEHLKCNPQTSIKSYNCLIALVILMTPNIHNKVQYGFIRRLVSIYVNCNLLVTLFQFHNLYNCLLNLTTLPKDNIYFLWCCNEVHFCWPYMPIPYFTFYIFK